MLRSNQVVLSMNGSRDDSIVRPAVLDVTAKASNVFKTPGAHSSRPIHLTKGTRPLSQKIRLRATGCCQSDLWVDEALVAVQWERSGGRRVVYVDLLDGCWSPPRS